MKKLLLIFLLLFTLTLSANVQFSPFLDAEIKLVYKMNDNNITHSEIKAILKQQNSVYENALNKMMSDQDLFISSLDMHDTEIFALKKIMSINKRAGNTYAVLRDEVKLKSYQVVRMQNLMIKNILQSLNLPTIEEYEIELNKYISTNREQMHEIYSKDYMKYLDIDANSKTLRSVQKNIRDFYALNEISIDVVSYLYKFENKMYRLNKYSKYHLISFAIFINSNAFVQIFDPILYSYGLSVIKLIFILFLILMIYFFRKIVYVTLERYILKIDILKKYSQQILEVIRKPLEILILLINLNMVIYVYNDFSTNEIIARAFNIIYGFFFTYMVYKIINTIAGIRLNDVSNENIKMKNDLINVGIKILNFIILVIGVLIMLFFAGVNLTAVLSGLGIGGFAVAFAAKDTISNFFGTISILFSDVFSQGDWVAINGHEGVVVEIGLRVTTLRTFDNALIAIPNGTFASTDVKNWNKRTLGRRIKMSVGITYGSKSKDIKNAVDEIRDMLTKHPGIATKDTKHLHRKSQMAKLVSKDDLEGVKKTLLVHLDSFADSSINILIYCFSKSVKWNEWLDTKEDVMYRIMEILEKNNLEFAFPSLSIYNEKSN